MKISVHFPSLPLAMASLFLLSEGCSSKSTGVGLRSCYDTGSSVVCVKSAALSAATVDVNGDGTPDVFVCADDDSDSHDRKRDRDQSGSSTANGASDEDGDGVADDLDCGHRPECGTLTNAEEEGREEKMGSLSENGGGASGGDHGGDAGDNRGDNQGGGSGTGGDNHGGGAGSNNSGDSHGSGGQGGGHDDGKDEHPQTGCQPPPLAPATVS